MSMYLRIPGSVYDKSNLVKIQGALESIDIQPSDITMADNPLEIFLEEEADFRCNVLHNLNEYDITEEEKENIVNNVANKYLDSDNWINYDYMDDIVFEMFKDVTGHEM